MKRALRDASFEVLYRCWPVITVLLVYVSIPILIVASFFGPPTTGDGITYVERGK